MMHISKQMARFLIVGVVTNASLYIAYLYITYLGLDHKYAMTLVYITGVVMGFMLNKQWTFQHNGHINKVFIRYLILYFLGYFVNLGGLYFLVDIQRFPHQIVQLGISICMAFIFFVFQKLWVFQEAGTKSPENVADKKNITRAIDKKKRKRKE